MCLSNIIYTYQCGIIRIKIRKKKTMVIIKSSRDNNIFSVDWEDSAPHFLRRE